MRLKQQQRIKKIYYHKTYTVIQKSYKSAYLASCLALFPAFQCATGLGMWLHVCILSAGTS